jgi:hypothetical protein
MEKRRSFLWSLKTAVLVLLWLWSIGGGPSRAQVVSGAEKESAAGEVRIEGKGIRRLVLMSSEGDRREIERPGESMRLPEGEYRVYEAHLDGGYVCYPWREGIEWIKVEPNKPAALKIGGPLEQRVKNKRQGNVLVLSYELAGTGGNKYVHEGRSKRPELAVYKAGREVKHGRFEYG